jgi:hypothetical protein
MTFFVTVAPSGLQNTVQLRCKQSDLKVGVAHWLLSFLFTSDNEYDVAPLIGNRVNI